MRFIVYEDEREVITTNVSTCKGNYIKGKLSSNEVFEWPSLHMNTPHNKTTQTDFPVVKITSHCKHSGRRGKVKVIDRVELEDIIGIRSPWKMHV